MKIITLLFPLFFVTNFIHGMYQEPNGSTRTKEKQQRELPPYYDETKRIYERQMLQATQRKLELKKTLRNQPTPENHKSYQQAKSELNFAHENLNNLVNTYKDIQ